MTGIALRSATIATVRWRTASNKTTAAALDAFNDAILPAMGMERTKSALYP